MNLIEIKTEIPDVIYDIRYATPNNFTGKIIYTEATALLLPDALEALKNAAEEFSGQGLRIVVFDAHRSPEDQAKLREACSDDKYVSEIPRHARGNVIDLTLATQEGIYLDMGTDYDDFSERAHASYSPSDPTQAQNRQMLRSVMTKNGFQQYPFEWWDFELQV